MTDEYRPVPKPPLSNPMAEAMAEDAENARVAAANAVNAAPVAEDAPAPNEAPADPTDTDAPAAIEAAPNEDPAKPSKSNEKALLGRLGHLTREKKEAIERAADLTRQNQALQELLASQGRTPPADGSEAAPAAPVPQQQRTYTQADVEALATQKADLDAYNRQANDLYGIGKEKFGTWDDALANLNGAGIMSEPAIQRQMVEAALATGAAPDVINHLGLNLEEAVRISALPPARMGVELATLAAKLTRKAPAISSAPAPIGNGTVRGGTEAAVDLAKLAEGPMAPYIEARRKMGDRWANDRRGGTTPRDT